MTGGSANRLRRVSPRRLALAFLLVVGIALVVAMVFARLPPPLSGTGTLDQCYWGWPVVAFDGEDWTAALPDDTRANPPSEIPVAAWPSGMRFDETAGVLLDAQGNAVFHKGDRVRVAGTVVRTEGDPAPCFFTLGVKIETIAAP